MVLVLYVAIFLMIGLLVDIVRINAPTLSDGIYALVFFRITPVVTLGMGVVALVAIGGSMLYFKRIVLSGSEYKELSRDDRNLSFRELELIKILDETIRESNTDFMPKLYIMDAPYMNAFASGWSEENSLIALTTTLIEKLDRDELKAVIAHELSHIRHGDIRLTLAVGVLGNIMLLVANYAVYMFMGNSREKGAQMARTILLVLQFVLPIITMALQMFLSRSREYMADSGAAYIMRDNRPMIRALQKISGSYASNDFNDIDTNKTRRAAYIFDPKEAFSTHPSIENRIKALLGR
ncbi:MAG: zinc metalloprotease HtpX [Wolinella sp.]